MNRVAILTVGRNLVVNLPAELYDAAVQQLEEDVAALAARREPEAVLLDLSAVDVVDSYITDALDRLVDLLRLMGCRLVLVGARPGVALALVELGLDPDRVHTVSNLEKALRETHRGGP